MPIADVGHLLALKVLSRDDRSRPQDRVDLAMVLLGATRADLNKARGAVIVLHVRGLHRNQDLTRDLERLLAGGV